jgi:carbon monoxide dehydrogenase subunit G
MADLCKSCSDCEVGIVKLEIGGNEVIPGSVEALWVALNDPKVLTRCVPGCKSMVEIGPDTYQVEMQLRVAAVGGSFEGEISLADKQEPKTCSIKVSGAGTLGHGNGTARFEIEPDGENSSRLIYKGSGEIGGLVAGVGQRILASVSKHLIGRFFVGLRKEFEAPISGAAAPGGGVMGE